MAFGDPFDATVDLTLVLDPAEVWADEDQCPDWPQRHQPDARGQVWVGEDAARERLAFLRHALTPGRPSRAPTDAEKATIKSYLFRQLDSPTVGMPGWYEIGFRGWGPVNHVQEERTRLMVEAMHIRGYLRKLDARRQRHAEAQTDDELRRRERAVEAYDRLLAERLPELSALAEAEARHQQRIEDELAHGRAADLRRGLVLTYPEAAQAARALGRDPPLPPPTFPTS